MGAGHVEAHVRDGSRAWASNFGQLHLALGSSVWSEMDKRCRPYLRKTNRSWRLDETYINIKGRQRFLYRAVDSTGQTIDFLLTDRRDARAAKRFFHRALRNEGNSMPRVIDVDKNPSLSRHRCGAQGQRNHQPKMPGTSMQVLKQYCGARSPQRKTANVPR